jgi:hypothetical protein
MEMDPTYKPANFGAFFYLDAPSETDLVALVNASALEQRSRGIYRPGGA